MTAIERLERMAARLKWRLFWSTERDVLHPGYAYRVLDIAHRGQPVLIDGPHWVRSRDENLDRASEMAAAAILSGVSRRGART